MFNLGFSEIILIGVIALVVLGPDQLPTVAKVLGRFFGELKRATDEFKKDFNSSTKDTRDVVQDLKTKVQTSLNDSLKEHKGAIGVPVENPFDKAIKETIAQVNAKPIEETKTAPAEVVDPTKENKS